MKRQILDAETKLAEQSRWGGISCRIVAGLAAIFVHAERRAASKAHEKNGDLSVKQWNIRLVPLSKSVVV